MLRDMNSIVRVFNILMIICCKFLSIIAIDVSSIGGTTERISYANITYSTY